MKQQVQRSGRASRLFLALALACAVEAGATNYYNRTSFGYWSSTNSWGGAVPPSSGDPTAVLVFTNGASITSTNDLGSTFTLNSMVFSNAGNVTLWGASTNYLVFTNSGGIAQMVQTTSATNTLSHNIVLGSDLFLSGSGSGDNSKHACRLSI